MTVSGSGFTGLFEHVARASGWASPPTPAQAIDAWEGFVEECERGYEFDFSEYLNGLSTRTLLQVVIDDAGRRGETAPVYESLVRRVGVLDDRFRTLLDEGVLVRPRSARWWERSIPAHGAPDFVEDVRARYSVELRTVET
ncbi:MULTISPECIES: hypothetical protein [unclassified Streptomyces]|uniref:hypothetical protein n=1 Tax=unclassified Streptomyces TaxID=2593676 RepID=UPI0037F9EAE2